ncbi:MAG: hypothetical protein AAGJ91_07755 [Pseudomonadota bacterium]
MAWSAHYSLLIIGLVAAPSLIARGVHEVTGDPLWRYLAIDEEGLAASEADIEADGAHVRIRVFWRGPDSMYETHQDVVRVLRRAFEAKGIEPFVVVYHAPSGNAEAPTKIVMRAGANTFGPIPIAEMARHIQPAVDAAHFAEQLPEETGRWWW